MSRPAPTITAAAGTTVLLLLLIVTLSSQAPSTGSRRQGTCAEGFSECSGLCYSPKQYRLDYTSAERRCAALNATLPVPRTRADSRCVGITSDGFSWLGVTDWQVEGQFVAADGTPAAELDDHWETGQPVNDQRFNPAGEDCVVLSGYWSGFWEDLSCSDTRPVLCQRPGGNTGCPERFNSCKGQCYSQLSTPLNYAAAELHCDALNATLPLGESGCLERLVGNRSVWLGVTDRQVEGQFMAADGTSLELADGSWWPGQPDNGPTDNPDGQDCVAVVPPYWWYDENCSVGRPFICQRPLEEPTPASTLLPSDCGTTFWDASSRVTGASAVSADSYPWQAQIQTTMGEHVCGGIIISDRHILTAAHCLDSRLVRNLQVVVGQSDLNKEDEEEQLFAVKAKYSHVQFDDHINGTLSNDIAVLLLRTRLRGIPRTEERPIVFGDEVRPACLPPDDLAENFTDCRVSGWGFTSNGTLPTLLHGTEIPHVTSRYCGSNDVWRSRFNGTTQLCAWDVDGGHDACNGDSGGPLVCRDRWGRWTAVGIVSWGDDRCGEKSTPESRRRVEVYTRVSAYLDWIVKALEIVLTR